MAQLAGTLCVHVVAARQDEKKSVITVYALNDYQDNNPVFPPICIGTSGRHWYKDADGIWQVLYESEANDHVMNVPGMSTEWSADVVRYYTGEYGEEKFEGKELCLVGTPRFTGTAPHKGWVKEVHTIGKETTEITTRYHVYVDDAYDMYTNAVAVYPALVNQSADGNYAPVDFTEGWISLREDLNVPEGGDVYVVRNSAGDTRATPRGIYRLDVENADNAALNWLDVKVTYYHTNGRQVLGEETYTVDSGLATFYVGGFRRQEQYDAYTIVITVVADAAARAGRYRLRIGRTKPVVLVHGIRSHPHNQDDVRNGTVFCDDLHHILESNYYCKCYFLCHDTGRDAVNEVLYGYGTGGKTGYYQLVEHCSNRHGSAANSERVAVFAHSEGAALTRLYANSWPASFRTCVGTVVTAGGVHLGSAFANAWQDSAVGPLAWLAGCTIETKNTLEIGGAVSLYNNEHPIPEPVEVYAVNGNWGPHPESYMNSIIQDSGRWLPRHFTYGEIDRVYRDASDGMVPHLSACPAGRYTSGLLTHGGGVAHDVRGTAQGPNTETHMSWDNYHLHPTYRALAASVFDTGQAGLAPVPQRIGVVMLPGIPRAYFGALFGSV